MAVDGGAETVELPLDYKFEFVLRGDSRLSVDEDVLSGSCAHRGDVWQLEVRADGTLEDLQSEYICKLRLVSSGSELKMTRVVVHRRSEAQLVEVVLPGLKDATILYTSGDQFTIGKFFVGPYDLIVHVDVLKYIEAKPISKPTVHTVKTSFTDDLLRWFKVEDFGDTVVVANDGIKFRCYQDILAQRSPVFREIFSRSDLKEAQKERVVKIDDFDGDTVSSLLLFIYTNKCGEIGSIVHRLYASAVQYELDELKGLCETTLAANLSEVNVAETLKLGKHYRLDNLMSKCLDHMASDMTISSHIIGVGDDSIRIGESNPPGHSKFTFTTDELAQSELDTGGLIRVFTLDNDDLWQLELNKVSVDGVSCQLRLIDTPNALVPKFLCITWLGREKRQNDGDSDRTPMALYRSTGDKFDFGLLPFNSTDDVKFDVRLVKWHRYVTTPSETEPSNSQFATEVLSWFQSEDFGDTEVVSRDGMRFKCHWQFLARRSEVFLRQLESSLVKEENENIVNVERFDGEIVEQLLLFIYTDECGDEIGSIAHCLYNAAHHYQLDRLRFLCETALVSTLSPSSISKTSHLARFYHLDHLLAVCVDYEQNRKAETTLEGDERTAKRPKRRD